MILRDEWPTIQARGQDSPLIVFANDTVLGSAAAGRWAELVCAWMNEQMRLGMVKNRPRNCDALVLERLHKAEAELAKLNLENQSLHSRLMQEGRTILRVAAVLRSSRERPSDFMDPTTDDSYAGMKSRLLKRFDEATAKLRALVENDDQTDHASDAMAHAVTAQGHWADQMFKLKQVRQSAQPPTT